MEYKIIALNDHKVFEDTVNNLLDAGWVLSGNLVVSRTVLRDGSFDECFYQSMVKTI